jgi:hypothetical protein
VNPIDLPLRKRFNRFIFLRVALYPPNIFEHGQVPPDCLFLRVSIISKV